MPRPVPHGFLPFRPSTMMRKSRLHQVFGADDLQPSAGDVIVMQPTSSDPWYDDNWQYIAPYQLLVYGTVMKPGDSTVQQFDTDKVKKGEKYTLKTVPETDGGKAWYAVVWDEKTRDKYNRPSADGSPRQDFPYWPTAWRQAGTIVKVLPKSFRVMADEMKIASSNEDARRTYQVMLDALTSIFLPRVSAIVNAATKGTLDEDGNDRARAAVAKTLAKAVFSLWYSRISASRGTPMEEYADKGILLFSDDSLEASANRQGGAWDTLGQLRTFADSLTSEVGLPDFDKPDDAGGNGFSRALAKIARDPASPDSLTGGTTPADLLTALAKTGTVALTPELMSSAASSASMMWTVKRSDAASPAPVAPVAPPPTAPTSTPTAPSIIPAAAAATQAETTTPTPQRGGMGARDAGASSWLLPVAAGVLGLAVVSALVRRD